MLIESTSSKRDSTIHLFRRDEENPSERKYEKVEDFEPYFLVPEHESVSDNRVKRTEDTDRQGLDGEDLKKVVLRSTRDVRQVREKFDKHYEADVSFTNRYILDELKGDIPKEPIRTHYFDIEVSDEGGFPDVDRADQPILSISTYDNMRKKYITFAWQEGYEGNVIKEKKSNDDIRLIFESEEEMMDKYLEYIQDTNPDSLAGWNSVSFDLKYICNRLDTLRSKMPSELLRKYPLYKERLAPVEMKHADGVIYVDDYVRIKGRYCFDLLKAYRTLKYGQQDSYKLDDVAKNEIGAQKIPMELGFAEMWREEFETFLDYNKRDVKLTVDLDEEMGITDFWDEVRRITNNGLEEVLVSMRQVDNYILGYANLEKNLALPSKGQHDEENPASGGFVLEATPGITQNVAVVDLKSLYPTIIQSFNLSPETVDPEGEIDIMEYDKEVTETKIVDGEKVEETKTVKEPVRFTKEQDGLLPQIFDELFEKRNEFKKEMKEAEDGSRREDLFDTRQYGIKVVMNTVFGVCLNPYFRLYEPKVGRGITKIGRELIKWSAEVVKDAGYEAIYSDTDSVFIGMGEEADLEDVQFLVEKLNESYDDFAQQFGADNRGELLMEFEKVYDTLFMGTAKKRYCGLKVAEDDYNSYAIHTNGGKAIINEGTEVVLEDGSTKPVEELEEGDKINVSESDLSEGAKVKKMLKGMNR